MFSAKPSAATTTISAATVTRARMLRRSSASSISSLAMYGCASESAVESKLMARTRISLRQYGARYARTRPYPESIGLAIGVHLVVTHVPGTAMLGRLAQRFRALDHVQLGYARAGAIDNIAHHFHAGQFLERRGLAPDNFERSDAD